MDGPDRPAAAVRPLRLQTTTPSEDELHEAVVALLRTVVIEPPAAWACYPSGHIKLSKADAAKLTRAGLRRGFPDFLLWHNGRSYGLELKATGGRLSKGYWTRNKRGTPIYREGQEDVFPRLMQAGMTIAVCWGLADVIAALEAWGIPRRRTR